MPTARYGELARQVSITDCAGAVHVSKPLPVYVPGWGGSAAGVTVPAARATRTASAESGVASRPRRAEARIRRTVDSVSGVCSAVTSTPASRTATWIEPSRDGAVSALARPRAVTVV